MRTSARMRTRSRTLSSHRKRKLPPGAGRSRLDCVGHRRGARRASRRAVSPRRRGPASQVWSAGPAAWPAAGLLPPQEPTWARRRHKRSADPRHRRTRTAESVPVEGPLRASGLRPGSDPAGPGYRRSWRPCLRTSDIPLPSPAEPKALRRVQRVDGPTDSAKVGAVLRNWVGKGDGPITLGPLPRCDVGQGQGQGQGRAPLPPSVPLCLRAFVPS